MDLDKTYYDQDGRMLDILQLCAKEPAWAANRVQEGEKAIARVKELENELENERKVYRLVEGAILELSKKWDEHPEDYNGPCECATCMSYADGCPPWNSDTYIIAGYTARR